MMEFKQISKKYQAGVTSLLVTVAVAMMLVAIIAGIAAFSIREQRQASNTEQSNRALQTAEAGVKDAVQQLSANPNINQPNCTPVNNIFPDQTNQQITCRTITTQFTSIEGALEKDSATQIQIIAPSAAEAANSMQLRWHSVALDQTLSQYFFNGQFYPPANNYNNAAAIELTFIYWPRTSAGPINGQFLDDSSNHNSGLRTSTRFFMPGQADKANGFVNSGCSDQGTTNLTNLGADYRCVTNSNSAVGFNLQAALGLPNPANSYDYIVRIKSRYADTHFQARFFNTDNKEILVKSTKALIDVTARSSDLYRRVQAEKPIIPTSLENLFDAVLFAGRGSDDKTDKNICKNMVIDDQNQLVSPNTCEN